LQKLKNKTGSRSLKEDREPRTENPETRTNHHPPIS